VSIHAEPSAYALLTDGTTIEIRAARPGDFAAVRDMHTNMSRDNLYLRFFSMSPIAAEQEACQKCRPSGSRELLAVLDGEVVGCSACERVGAGSRSADVAFTVADEVHHRGIGTLLLGHLVSLARRRDIRAYTADTLGENARPCCGCWPMPGCRRTAARKMAFTTSRFRYPLTRRTLP
jgi:predicted N-acetyltransferase YhbS